MECVALRLFWLFPLLLRDSDLGVCVRARVHVHTHTYINTLILLYSLLLPPTQAESSYLPGFKFGEDFALHHIFRSIRYKLLNKHWVDWCIPFFWLRLSVRWWLWDPCLFRSTFCASSRGPPSSLLAWRLLVEDSPNSPVSPTSFFTELLGRVGGIFT